MTRISLKCWMTLALAVSAISAAPAADIVTLPTANQLKAGQVEAAYYRLDLDYPPGAPTNMGLATLYYGFSNRFEVDAWWIDPNKGGDEIVINPSYLLVQESSNKPSLVVGAQDLFNALKGKPSWYVAGAKTIRARKGGLFPVVRLHAGWGSKANSGFFGGVQAMIYGPLGMVLLHSQNEGLLGGENLIAGLTFTFPKMPLVLKGGVLGKHTWIGIAYTFDLPFPHQ